MNKMSNFTQFPQMHNQPLIQFTPREEIVAGIKHPDCFCAFQVDCKAFLEKRCTYALHDKDPKECATYQRRIGELK